MNGGEPIMDPDLALRLYRGMVRIRMFESRLQEVYRSGVMPGFIHLYIGEEAVATGVCAHLTRDDYVTSTHRGHGHALAKGLPAGEVFAEVWGQTRGSNGGRGGSMHIYDPAFGFLGTNGIVGAGIPIAAGAGLAAQVNGTGRVAVSFFGDGASNNCAFHEGINLAAAWDLPVVFVCENNMYATQTPFEKVTRNVDVATRATAYGIPGFMVDGNDVLAVHAAAGDAIARARAGKGPTLIECKTYRLVGHFEGDPGTTYRSKEEIESWRRRDPIERLRSAATASGAVAADRFAAIDREVEAEIAEAYEFAKASPAPDPASVEQFVY